MVGLDIYQSVMFVPMSMSEKAVFPVEKEKLLDRNVFLILKSSFFTSWTVKVFAILKCVILQCYVLRESVWEITGFL